MEAVNGKMRRKQNWYFQPLTPLMEGPHPHQIQPYESTKKERSWEFLRHFIKLHKNPPPLPSPFPISTTFPNSNSQDLRLLLGVLACPLSPIPLPLHNSPPDRHLPIETSVAEYIIHQYLAATGCFKQQKCAKNMYATGTVKMIRCETEVCYGKTVKTVGTRRSSGDNGCFVVWQMVPGMWSLELVVSGSKVVAGSDGKTVWRHTPWLGTHAAKGPQRPLRRIIQGLDPRSTARLFGKAQCMGEKRIGEDDCFVLKVWADRDAVMERNDGAAEVIRHVLYGYFCQKSGVLVYLEDSQLTRVSSSSSSSSSSNRGQIEEEKAVYWETTIGSWMGDYREVDGLLIAHQGRSIATIFNFGEQQEVEEEEEEEEVALHSPQFSRTRMEELWNIDDIVFNVPGLEIDYFIPPADIFDHLHSPN